MIEALVRRYQHAQGGVMTILPAHVVRFEPGDTGQTLVTTVAAADSTEGKLVVMVDYELFWTAMKRALAGEYVSLLPA
jgi:hypothetical protein